MVKNDLDSGFIDRVIWTSLWVTVIVCLFFLAYKPYVPSGFNRGFLIGALCGIGNLYFLKTIIVSFIRPDGVRWLRGLVGVVGIHAVIAAFLYVIWLKAYSFTALLIGFSICFVVAFLKAVSLSIAQNLKDNNKEN